MFIDNLEKRLNEKNISMNKLAEMLEISQAAVSKWKYGAMPGIDKLIKICEVLEVSADELLDISPPETPPPELTNQFSKPELQLINMFRELNLEQQEDILDNISSKIERNKRKEKSLSSAG